MNTLHIEPGASIDTFLRAHRSATRFLLSPGVYRSRGSFAFADLDHSMLAPGCELIGAGSDVTTLVVGDDAVPCGGAQLECLTAGSRSSASETIRVRGLTVQPGDSTRTREDLGIVGLHVWSDRCEISDIVASRITGIRGSKTGGDPGPSREGFGLLVNRPGKPARPGGSRINQVRVELLTDAVKKTEHYVCACYVGVVDPAEPSLVDDVVVTNLSGTPAHAGFGVNGGVVGTRWRNVGRWNRGVFCDVTGGVGTHVSNSVLRAEWVGIEFRGGAEAKWRDMVVSGSHLTLAPVGDAGWGAVLVLADDTAGKASADFECVQVRDSVIRGESENVRHGFYCGTLDTRSARSCGLFGNAFFVPSGRRWLAPNASPGISPQPFAVV